MMSAFIPSHPPHSSSTPLPSPLPPIPCTLDPELSERFHDDQAGDSDNANGPSHFPDRTGFAE